MHSIVLLIVPCDAALNQCYLRTSLVLLYCTTWYVPRNSSLMWSRCSRFEFWFTWSWARSGMFLSVLQRRTWFTKMWRTHHNPSSFALSVYTPSCVKSFFAYTRVQVALMSRDKVNWAIPERTQQNYWMTADTMMFIEIYPAVMLTITVFYLISISLVPPSFIVPWELPAVCSVLFFIFSVYTVVEEGVSEVWVEHTSNFWGNQIWTDLLLGVALSWTMLLPKAREHSLHILGWLILTILTANIGLLAMHSRILYIEKKKKEKDSWVQILILDIARLISISCIRS